MLSKPIFYVYLLGVLSIAYTGPLFSTPVEVCFDLAMINGSGRGMEEVKKAAAFVNACLKEVSGEQVALMDIDKQISARAKSFIKQTAGGSKKEEEGCACNISSGSVPEGDNYLAATLGSGPEEVEDPGCVVVRPNTPACNAANTKTYIVSPKGARAYCQSKVRQANPGITFQVGLPNEPKANTDDIIEDVFDACKASKPEAERFAANNVCKAAVINKQQWEVYKERKGPRANKCGKTEEIKVNYGNVITCNHARLAQKLAIVFQERATQPDSYLCAVPGLAAPRAARNPTEKFSLKPINELFLAKGEKLKFREPQPEPVQTAKKIETPPARANEQTHSAKPSVQSQVTEQSQAKAQVQVPPAKSALQQTAFEPAPQSQAKVQPALPPVQQTQSYCQGNCYSQPKRYYPARPSLRRGRR